MAAAALFAASCSGTRGLGEPQIIIPGEVVAGSTDTLCIADMKWWEFYADSTLMNIIRRTLEHNRDFAASAARVEELRQLYGVQQLNYAPDVTGVVGATHETKDFDGRGANRVTEVSVKATLNWEIDLWGGLAAAKRAAGARFAASVEQRRALQITLIAEAATAYFNLVALENELSIVRRTMVTRTEALEKAKLRFEGGMTSELIYRQAQVEYAAAATLIPDLERRITVAHNALSLLMGSFPGAQIGNMPEHFEEIYATRLPLGLPSDLLQRRPDIRESEQNLRTALADCGVAYSDQFPRLRIGLTGGLDNDKLSGLLKSAYSFVLGNVAGTILNFGKNRRRYRAAIAAVDRARLEYEQCVMAAFTEVNSAAVNYRSCQQTVDARRELRDAAFQYVTLANKQYVGGTINYLDVLDATRRYFDAQINFSNAVRDQYLALVSLYKALGGGWQ